MRLSYTPFAPAARPLNARRRAAIERLAMFFAIRDSKIFWPDDADRISRGTGLSQWEIAQALDDLEAQGRAEMRPLGDRVVIHLQRGGRP